MAQVGCGSVGLIRTGSYASAGTPMARHITAEQLQNIRFMIASLFSDHACTELALCQGPGASEKTALARGKARQPAIAAFLREAREASALRMPRSRGLTPP
jgi:hypothetical protein